MAQLDGFSLWLIGVMFKEKYTLTESCKGYDVGCFSFWLIGVMLTQRGKYTLSASCSEGWFVLLVETKRKPLATVIRVVWDHWA